MDTLDLSMVDEEQADGLTRWTTGPVAFKIKYASPRQATKFSRRMEMMGITKRDGDIVRGKESEYCMEFAREYVIDWRGVTEKKIPIAFDAARMGQIIQSHRDVFNMLHDAIKASDDFFVGNGNGSTPS